MRTLILIIVLFLVLPVVSFSGSNMSKIDPFVKSSCEQTLQTTIRKGFNYSDSKPHGIRNRNNWSFKFNTKVSLNSAGNEISFLKAMMDKMSYKADKIVYKFKLQDGYSVICRVGKNIPHQASNWRDVHGVRCIPQERYGCMSICDNEGASIYNCRTGERW